MTDDAYWAVAQTIATREDTVAERLGRAGFKTLAPKSRFRVAGREFRIAAIFPGYVFVRIADGCWYDARWCMGVLRLVMAGDRPARVPDWEIKKIVDATQKNGLVRIPKEPRTPPRTLIREGAAVRILTGSFRGLHAVYAGMSIHDRHQVLLDLLGRQVKTELAPEDVVESA